MTTTPTPITDAVLSSASPSDRWALIDSVIDHARRMERDRARLIEALKWAMGAGHIKYSERTSTNSRYCDKVDSVRALLSEMEAK